MKKLILFIIILSSINVFGQVNRKGEEFDSLYHKELTYEEETERRRKLKKRWRGADTTNYFRIGIIPYQILSRSFGGYCGFSYKNLSIEYRLTYTRATGYVSNFFANDKFYYQGINNTVILYFAPVWKLKVGLIFLQRNWWYDNKWVTYNNNTSARSDSWMERKSAKAIGLGGGRELLLDFSYKYLDFGVFVNGTITQFILHYHVFEPDEVGRPYTYPRDEKWTGYHVAVTKGLRIGFRSKLNK